MTLIKEKAMEMIQRIPDDRMLYVINILQNLEAMAADQEENKEKAHKALQDILNMEKRLPADFDPQIELQEALEQKYDNFG